MNLLIPNLPQNLSFSKSLSSFHFLPTNTTARPPPTTVIRMGGGPRTYPGGVSKWQWKRMQAKKAKQLLKARLCRERQIYEMRKRAELRAAVSELERPWEPVEQAPTLFSVRADEQVKVLADRFQKPGGFDLWSERDGPQLFETPDELPSARFFPKGVVHSVQPYRRISADKFLEDVDGDNVDGNGDGEGSSYDSRFLSEDVGDGSDDGQCSSTTLNSWGNNGVNIDGGPRKNGRNQRRFLSENADDGGFSSSSLDHWKNGQNANGRMRKNGNGRRILSKGVSDGSDNGESSSSLSYGKNEGNHDGRMKRSGNGRRPFFAKGVGDGSDNGESSPSSLSYGKNKGNHDGRMKRSGNGRRPFFAKGVGDGSDNGESSSSFSYGRNGGNHDGRMKRSGNGRRPFAKGVDDYGSEDGVSSSLYLSSERNGGNVEGRMRKNGSERNGGNVDGRMRKNGNGRRFISKGVNRTNELYSGKVGPGMKHRGKYSGDTRNGGTYSRGTSGYASTKIRDAVSEVYDMDLHQDGSYQFQQKSEKSDTENW